MSGFGSGILGLACGWPRRFAVLFLSGGFPISHTCKFLASKWEKSQKWSWVHACLRVGKILSAELWT